jgi:hypothetical protein
MKYLPQNTSQDMGLEEVYFSIKKIIEKIETKNKNYNKKIDFIETQIENIWEFIDASNKYNENIKDLQKGIILLEKIIYCIQNKIIKEYTFSTTIEKQDILDGFVDNNKYDLIKEELRIWYFNDYSFVASWNDIEQLGLPVKLDLYNNQFILHF